MKFGFFFPLIHFYVTFILICIFAFYMSEEGLNEPAKNEKGENNL